MSNEHENKEIDKVITIDINKEMQKCYIDYAMSVIVARALPDARDGLKPVQRRILYSMNEMNLDPNKGYRKSARIVGDTMGKYHPHGDSSIYQAMVRMAQNFSMRYMLVDGHGNFGSIDGDSAAAAMIVLRIIRHLNVELTPAIATCLYTAIATDTGCFKYSNADAEAHRMAADCMEVGIPYEMINRVNFDMKSRARIELERMALDGMEFHHDGRVAVMTITNEMVAQSGAGENDMEGLPPIPRQIEGVWGGITLRQKEDGNYKVSVRTGTHADAAEVCVLLGGGGHNRAAGCTIEGTLSEAKAAVLAAAEKAIPRVITG